MRIESCGILLYRRSLGRLEVLIGHPGGPFWARRDQGVWSIPKGEPRPGESGYETALREFDEETGHRLDPESSIELGWIQQKAGKVVHAWAVEYDLDSSGLRSNTFELEWPPGSGRRAEYPEIDRFAWASLGEAAIRLNPAQAEFLIRLRAALQDET